MKTCPLCAEDVPRSSATCPICRADLTSIARDQWHRFAKAVWIYLALHVLMWVPIVAYCIFERPPYVRPMVQWPFSAFGSLVFVVWGCTISIRQLLGFPPKRLAIATFILSWLPLIAFISTTWFINDYLGVPDATS